MKFNLSLLFFLCLNTNTLASFPEFFGASATTSSLGGQSNFDISDASNNYYFASLLGFSDKVNFTTGANSTATHFEPIKNVVVQNPSNSSQTEVRADVSTDYLKYYNYNIHIALPIGREHLGTLGVSLFGPIGHLIEGDSGHPYNPEYVMYRARYKRTSGYVNFAKKFSNNFALSLGAYIGFQATANANLNLGLNGTSYGTSGRAKTKVDPSLATIFSMAYKADSSTYAFQYQQEMKSNLQAEATGELSNPVNLPFVSKIDSMMFYDPHTFRTGFVQKFDVFDFVTSVEYQMWDNYKPSKIKVTKVSGTVEGSREYENIEVRNIFVPKLGLRTYFLNRWSLDFGFSYRPTPLKSDFSGAGNSIDTDTFNYAGGLHYIIKVDGHDVALTTSLMYSDLKRKVVTKTSGVETGANGLKIGAPGYIIDGTVVSGTFGLKINF